MKDNYNKASVGRQLLNVIFQDGCGSDRALSIGQARSFRLQYSTKTECKVRKHSNPLPTSKGNLLYRSAEIFWSAVSNRFQFFAVKKRENMPNFRSFGSCSGGTPIRIYLFQV